MNCAAARALATVPAGQNYEGKHKKIIKGCQLAQTFSDSGADNVIVKREGSGRRRYLCRSFDRLLVNVTIYEIAPPAARTDKCTLLDTLAKKNPCGVPERVRAGPSEPAVIGRLQRDEGENGMAG